MARHKTYNLDYVPKWNVEIRARKLPVAVYTQLSKLIGISETVLYAIRYSPLEANEAIPVEHDYDPKYSTIKKIAKFFKTKPHELENKKKDEMSSNYDFNAVLPGMDIKMNILNVPRPAASAALVAESVHSHK